MRSRFFSKFDYLLMLAVFALVTIGIMFIYSSSINSEGISVTNEHIKQIVWASIGVVLMVTLTLYDYRRLQSTTFYLYIFLIILLIYTRIFGKYVNGAYSWIGFGSFGIQPSEFGKIFYILYLANFLYESRGEDQFKRFIFATLIMLVPFGLIMLQPDLGTASVYIPIYLIMCFMAEVPVKYIGYILLFGCLTIFNTVLPVWNSEIANHPVAIITILTNMKLRTVLIFTTLSITIISHIVRKYLHGPEYFKWIAYIFSAITVSLIFSIPAGKVLKDYQIKRLIIFMNPDKDPRGAGWNIIQSKVAIGAGGLFGQSYLHGTQSHYRFLPQQSTDFIFSIISEEIGFLGACVIFAVYSFILLKILWLLKTCANSFGTYIASGIFGMFLFHFFINVGMVMGMMPITGIPLLFLSYGGSSLLMAMSCIGFIMSISYRRKNFNEIE